MLVKGALTIYDNSTASMMASTSASNLPVYSSSILTFVETPGSRLQGLTKGFKRRDCQNVGKKTPIYLYCVLCSFSSSATALLIDQVMANPPSTMFEHSCTLRQSRFSHCPGITTAFMLSIDSLKDPIMRFLSRWCTREIVLAANRKSPWDVQCYGSAPCRRTSL